MYNWTIADKTLTNICDNASIFLNCIFSCYNLTDYNNFVCFDKNNLVLPKMYNNISIILISIADITFFVGYYKCENVDSINESIRGAIGDKIKRNCFIKSNFLEELKDMFEKIITSNCLFVIYPYGDDYFDSLSLANYIKQKTAVVRISINLRTNTNLFTKQTGNQVNFYSIKI